MTGQERKEFLRELAMLAEARVDEKISEQEAAAKLEDLRERIEAAAGAGEPSADIIAEQRASITLLTGATEAGREWLQANVAASAGEWLGDTLPVDFRAAWAILEGARADGLTVAESEAI